MHGGRLLTLAEIKYYLKEKGSPFPGENQMVACTVNNEL